MPTTTLSSRLAATGALRDASIAVEAAIDTHVIGPLGIEAAIADLLVRLSLAEPAGLRGVEIGEQLAMQPARVSRLTDRAEHLGVVARTTDPNDRRAHRVVLTEAGRRQLDALLPRLLATVDDIVREEFTPAEVTTLVELLGRLRRRALEVAG